MDLCVEVGPRVVLPFVPNKKSERDSDRRYPDGWTGLRKTGGERNTEKEKQRRAKRVIAENKETKTRTMRGPRVGE